MRTHFLHFVCVILAGLSFSFVEVLEVMAQPQVRSNTVLPTHQEIVATNSRLPVLVAEGTMWTKVEYDDNTKTQRFYYGFTEDVDKKSIGVAQEQGKKRMINALRQNPRSMDRINAGMTYIYLYYSKYNTKLYEIRISRSDF